MDKWIKWAMLSSSDAELGCLIEELERVLSKLRHQRHERLVGQLEQSELVRGQPRAQRPKSRPPIPEASVKQQD